MTPELTRMRAAVERELAERLPQASPIAQPLVDAMRYAVLSGGKRIRPLLVCASNELFWRPRFARTTHRRIWWR